MVRHYPEDLVVLYHRYRLLILVAPERLLRLWDRLVRRVRHFLAALAVQYHRYRLLILEDLEPLLRQ